jgi:hypothetical protein
MTYSEFGKKIARYLIKNGEIDIYDCVINIFGAKNPDCNGDCQDCWKNELSRITDGKE